jgi:hypothetical protein
MTRRSPDFPSWSWAGWEGPVKWYSEGMEVYQRFETSDDDSSRDEEYVGVDDFLDKRTWIDWYLVNLDGRPTLVWDKQQMQQQQDLVNVLDDLDFGEKYGYSGAKPGNPYGRDKLKSPRFPGLKQQRWATPDLASTKDVHGTGILQFWTASAFFRIVKSDVTRMELSLTHSVLAPNGLAFFMLYDTEDRASGWVLLNDDIELEAHEKEEFVMISEGKHYHSKCDGDHVYPRDEEHHEEFNAIMIRWNKGGIAERVGLGRAMKEAVLDSAQSGLVWKEILLA